MAWRSIAPIRPEGLTSLQLWLGDECFFGLCPVGDGRTYGFGNVTGPRLQDPVQGRLGRLRNRFARFGGLVQEYLASLEQDEQIHCGPIEWLELDEWRAGRVVLIGDAAHASLPMMGQGGCMAMEDAVVLAEILCSADNVESALDAYVERAKAEGRLGPIAEPRGGRKPFPARSDPQRGAERARRLDVPAAVRATPGSALTPNKVPE